MKTRLIITFILLIIIGFAATCVNKKKPATATQTESVTDTIPQTDGNASLTKSVTEPEVFTTEEWTYVVGTASEVCRYLTENGIKDYQGPFYVTNGYEKPSCDHFESLDRRKLEQLRRNNPEDNIRPTPENHLDITNLHYAAIRNR
jgi:hypothetical protein